MPAVPIYAQSVPVVGGKVERKALDAAIDAVEKLAPVRHILATEAGESALMESLRDQLPAEAVALPGFRISAYEDLPILRASAVRELADPALLVVGY